MTHQRSPSDAGFTLVELLAAIAVLGLLTILLTTGVRAIIRSSAAVHQETHNAEVVEQMERVISHYLTQARPTFVWNETATEPVVDFHGNADALRFRAVLPPELGGWDAYFSLTLNDEATADLILRVVGVTGLPEQESIILLPNVRTLYFAYWGTHSPDDPPEWKTEWINAPELPELVRLTIQQKEHLISIIIHPIINNN